MKDKVGLKCIGDKHGNFETSNYCLVMYLSTEFMIKTYCVVDAVYEGCLLSNHFSKANCTPSRK